MPENKQENVPKQWKVLAKFSSFEEANDKKKLILQNSDNVLVKIRRRADNTFDVKGYTVPKESSTKKKVKKSKKKSSKSKD